jgi:glycosyltransferase involved in cell wall biosynthesis
MSENPLVSIIVRTKDRPKLLKRALSSIAAQTYRPLEVILVNDGGCDLDIEELKSILGDVSLNYIRLGKNMGRAHAGNAGIENAKGEYIGFLDDDDEFYPEHVETLISFLKQSDYKVAYTDAFFVYKNYDADTYEIKDVKKELAFSQDFDYDKLVFENYIPFMCLLFEKKVLIDSGGFDSNFDLYEDWELILRIGDEYPFHHIKKTTTNYNQWSIELQISQGNRNPDFLKQSYLKVISRHMAKITPNRIHGYVSSHTQANSLLKEFRNEIEKYIIQLNEKNAQINRLDETLKEKDTYIDNLESNIKEKNTYIDNLESTVRERDQYIASVENVLREKEAYIQLIHSGHGWKLLNRYYKVRDKLLPPETKRRLFAKLLLKMVTNPKEALSGLNKINLRKFLYYLKISDLSTLEKKIEQKLSYEVTDDKVTESKINEYTLPIKIANKDYFHFLFEMNTKKGEDYVSPSYQNIPVTDIKLIAFYLPQFHPIKENDEWWGKGFTEWTNVTRAVPQFIGHYQPRLPGELGFYDLRIPEIQERQIELARQYGIYGFCFHFYWFNGKTLLERPIKNFVENFDFPFCINWANENWTKRWDGKDNEILIAQKHLPNDDIEFIKYISKYLENKNYITIKSKPLLIIYRPALFSNPKAIAERWREWCINNGIGEIFLVATHSFEHIDPRSVGFDAVIEFPPNTFPLKGITSHFNIINPNYKGVILDYKNAIEYSRNYVKPPYKKFRGICPSWDNEARTPGRGTVLVNSTPDNCKEWLKILCHFTHNNFDLDERIIFINAWNEWAEGTYLEPDRRYGYAYLQAIADSLREYNSEKKQKKMIYICHDAHFHGAQLLSLNILKTLKFKFHYDVHFLLKSGGELEPEYKKYGTVYNLERKFKTLKEKEKLIEHLNNLGVQEAICNTVASGDITKILHEKRIKTITLVHELPAIIRQLNIEENANLLAEYSDKVVFPSDFVKEKFKTISRIDDKKSIILPQGLYKNNKYKESKHEARKELRERLSLPENAKIILGVGFGDHRKGLDLFVEVAKIITEERKDVYFLWVGNIHPEIEAMIGHEVKANKNIILHSAQKDVSLFYAGADVYILTSREDPFPAVVLEAMDVGLPVIGFHGAGGFQDIVNENTGALVPYLDVNAMAKEIINLLDDSQKKELLERNTRTLIEEKFNFTNYIYKLLELLEHDYKKVSVIIPNYNYEKYLKLRISSILSQTYPIYEIIFLDDSSTDKSLKIAESYIEEGLNMKLIKNETNSGSVFKQWLKGLQMVKGDYIWIAEADDLCENTFLEEILSCFERDEDVVLAYCQSKQMDEHGKILSENYFEYTNDIDKEKWTKNYIREGSEEILDTLVVKNTIPNVSAVVFKKFGISSITNEIINFKIAGDWLLYIWLLKQGKIAYVSKSLNFHRRHERGVTKSEDKELHYNEVVKMQEYIMNNFNVPLEVRDKVLFYREYLKGILGLKF